MKTNRLSSPSLVTKVQEKGKQTVKEHQDNQCESSREDIAKAQRELDEAYLAAETKFIQGLKGKISNLKTKNIAKQHAV